MFPFNPNPYIPYPSWPGDLSARPEEIQGGASIEMGVRAQGPLDRPPTPRIQAYGGGDPVLLSPSEADGMVKKMLGSDPQYVEVLNLKARVSHRPQIFQSKTYPLTSP